MAVKKKRPAYKPQRAQRGTGPKKQVFVVCINHNSWFSDPEYVGKNGGRVKDKKKARRFTRKAALEYLEQRGWPLKALDEI